MFRLLLPRTRRARAASAVTVGLAALMLSVGPAGAATPTPFNHNLVKNPGAEAGAASSDGQSGVTIPNWEGISDSHFTVVRYGTAGGFPTAAEGQRIGGGKQFFAAGVDHFGDCDNISQSIFIIGRNSPIDGHHVKLVLSAWVATYDGQTDNAIVRVNIGDDSNNSLGSLVLPTQSATNDTFHHLKSSKLLPSHTRELTVSLQSSTHQGAYCDAYFDKISVKLVQV
jgi:hypothetical protein